MTTLSQDDIIGNTKTVIQGLDTLKNEHHQILNGLLTSMKTIKKENNGDTNLMEEKTDILKKSLETIELGLGEAQVSDALFIISSSLYSKTCLKQPLKNRQNKDLNNKW